MEVSDADRVVAMCIVLEHSVITFGGVEQAKLGVDAAQALSTQAAELDALRGEVAETKLEKWALRTMRGIEKGDTGFGVSAGWKYYLLPADTLQHERDMAVRKAQKANEAAIAHLRDRVAGLEEGVSDLLPRGVCWDNPNIPDDTVLPIDMTMGEIRKARALLTQNEVG